MASKKPAAKKKAAKKEPENKTGLTTSGVKTPKFVNMRRSELAKLVKHPDKKTKDQLIEELSQ